ncbi:MAG: THUMP domain-containing class I SAM-dependent RNA methyltransferase [Bacteriovoracaceae bacterium]
MTEKDKEIERYKNTYLVSCPKGVEELLLKELSDLGIVGLKGGIGGATFEGRNEDFLKVILYSRLASRVYKKLFSFDIKTEKDLYFFGKEIQWSSIFGLDQTFKIQTILMRSPDGKKKSKFSNTMILSQTLKDGIVDRFRDEEEGLRPNVNKQNADASFVVHIAPHDSEHAVKEKVTVMVDLCGEPLSHRGYRDPGFEAPLRENLAAAIVMAMEWNKKETFIDLMCGSGTLLIEAAMFKANIPASYFKIKRGVQYSFFNLYLFNKDKGLTETWEKEVKLAIQEAKKGIENLKNGEKIYGYDLNHQHLNMCQTLIDKCELTSAIIINREDATRLKNNFAPGLLVANPPYGERMGSDEDLAGLYYNLGENLKQEFKGFRAYIFTGNLPLIKKISLKTSSKRILYNGDIECRLVRYNLF